MPSTRPSTRVQRRAQPFVSRRHTRNHNEAPVPPVTTSQESLTTSGAVESTISSTLSTAEVTSIATAVAQSVLASLQSALLPTPIQNAREVPLVSLPGPSEADAQVQGPVASALEGLSGESVNLEVARPQPLGLSHFNSITMPIDAQVSPKIKAKIWAHEFVEFGLLINPRVSDTRYQLSINQNDNSVPTLSLEPSSRIKPINTIDLWTSAFQIFVGVYTSKFPQEAPSLMKYGEVVRDLAARGGNWRFYDTQFRSLRQSNVPGMPWGTTHWELWIRAQNMKPNTQARPNSSPASTVQLGPFVPLGYCRKYHKGFKCAGCNYKHQCFKCGATHCAKSCNFRPSRPSTPSSKPLPPRASNASNH